MKKIKMISVRVSAEDYDIMYEDYLRLKNSTMWTAKGIYKIQTFSDYIRFMLIEHINK